MRVNIEFEIKSVASHIQVEEIKRWIEDRVLGTSTIHPFNPLSQFANMGSISEVKVTVASEQGKE